MIVHAWSHEKGQLSCLGKGGGDRLWKEIMPWMSLKGSEELA